MTTNQPTSAHVDRVLQAILEWEGRARKQMTRRAMQAKGQRRTTAIKAEIK